MTKERNSNNKNIFIYLEISKLFVTITQKLRFQQQNNFARKNVPFYFHIHASNLQSLNETSKHNANKCNNLPALGLPTLTLLFRLPPPGGAALGGAADPPGAPWGPVPPPVVVSSTLIGMVAPIRKESIVFSAWAYFCSNVL